MNRRIQLFEEALMKCQSAFEKAPYMFPLESVLTQIRYLLDVERGHEIDRSRLATISIGQIAARDIDSFDESLGELLHEASAEARKMLGESCL